MKGWQVIAYCALMLTGSGLAWATRKRTVRTSPAFEIQAVAFLQGEHVEVEKSDESFRCSRGGEIHRAGEFVAYLPDSVLPGDPVWSVRDAVKRNQWNGTLSGWCLKHAMKAFGH